jgi:sortase A
MARRSPLSSRVLLILGSLLMLGGAGYGLWSWLRSAAPPVITDAGAVVAAETAPPRPTHTATPAPPSPTPAVEPAAELPTPALLPAWEPIEEEVTPTAVSEETPLPRPSPTPSPTPRPAADEPPTRITAPAIELDAKLVPMGWEMVNRKGTLVSTWVVPKKAAGWHENSALPGHGENVVLSGHHNIEGKVFRYVVDLSPGDEITLYVGDTPYPYIVTEKYILKEAGMPLSVRQKNAQWIMPTGDERLTLVTCWPYEWPGNTHRVIVVARPPDSLTEETDDIR